MGKVRVYAYRDMTVIDCGRDPYRNFLSHDHNVHVVNVTKVLDYKCPDMKIVETDFRNPYTGKIASFLLNLENFNNLQWVE